MNAKALDHIALWVPHRDAVAAFATERLGMHVIDRTDAFTLVGSDARRGKLTLFDAERPRERGALKHVALRVNDLRSSDGSPAFDLGEGLRVLLVEAATDTEYDLDHVALYSPHPDETAAEYLALGFEPAAPRAGGVPRVQTGGAFVEFHEGDVAPSERPLLNHLGILVDSADAHIAAARDLGLEIADIVDAANTYAVFVWGPDRVKIEYVEHKASFSLV
jgi:catechol 2,3-dioxygenase-like lactoylglutathione lyase family enzyme